MGKNDQYIYIYVYIYIYIYEYNIYECVCVNTLRHTATHCNTLHPLDTRYPSSSSVLQCVAGCCNVLQCVAVCCSVLQCVAVCCSVSHVPTNSHFTLCTYNILFTMYNPCIAIERERARARMCAHAIPARARAKFNLAGTSAEHTATHCQTLQHTAQTACYMMSLRSYV